MENKQIVNDSLPSDDELLTGALSTFGRTAGKEIGMSQATTMPGLSASALGKGAKIGSSFLNKKSFDGSVTLSISVVAAIKSISEAISAQGGKILNQKITDANSNIVAIVSAGAMNMNPAVLHIEVVNNISPTNQTTVKIQGVAKEGLFDQHTARKAVERLINVLQHSEEMEKTAASLSPESTKSNVNALICITAGIVSLLGIFVVNLGILGGVGGIISAIRGRKAQNKSLVITGAVLSVIGLILTVVHLLSK